MSAPRPAPVGLRSLMENLIIPFGRNAGRLVAEIAEGDEQHPPDRGYVEWLATGGWSYDYGELELGVRRAACSYLRRTA